ncbi:MAG: T9SS type A sorting domain-containing protein, partial [Fidelibacterota bacterium]
NVGSMGIWQNDLTLRIGPTITSSEFEIAIARNSDIMTLNGSQVLVEGRIVIAEAPPNSDIVPNEPGGISFNIGEDTIPLPEPISLERRHEDDIRIVTYNTLWNGILEEDRQPSFQRIFQALDPDAIVLQEHTDWNEIQTIVQSWFPQETWYASWTYSDLVVLSRFPILSDANLSSSERTMCALLDTEAEMGKNLLIINSHLSCCGNNEGRQQQVDEFASVWRNWITSGNGPFELEDETPFVHVGDFNFVGYRQQVETIRIGDIENVEDYGNDFLPDWDSTNIVDLFSRHTHKRMGYTWRSDGSSYNPGKLDYVFYSDATIDTGKHFIVNTLAMDSTSLSDYGLEWDDTQEASDHLPRIFDISLDPNVGIDNENPFPSQFAILTNYPNPFNPITTVNIMVETQKALSLQIFDINGHLVNTLFEGDIESGNHVFQWDGSHFSSGVYFIRLSTGDFVKTRKMILLK